MDVRWRSIEELGFDPAAQARARRYTNAATAIALLDRGMVLLAALALGAAARPVFSAVARVVHPDWARAIVYTFLVFTAVQSSHLIPYRLRYRSDIAFGLTRAAPHAWWWAIGGLLLGSAFGTVLFVLVYAPASPIWRGVEWGNVGAILLYLTYRRIGGWGFGPPEEGRRLTGPGWERVQELAGRMRVKPPRVTVMESPQGRRLWAAFFAWSFFERIYVSQSLLDRLTPAETDAVLAHELAHKRYEILQLLVYYLAWVIPMMVVISALLPRLSALFGVTQGIEALPLFVFLVEGALLGIGPVTNVVSRWIERRADRLALRVIGDPDAFASAMVKLYDHDLIYAAPGRIWQLFFGTHPTGVERVQLARRSRQARHSPLHSHR